MAILTTKRLTKQFGGLVAIDNLDLSVKENSIHSVIGPNGAGKTTKPRCSIASRDFTNPSSEKST